MGKLTFGSGSIRLEMSDELDQIYRRAVETVAPGMLDMVETATDEVYKAAVAAWPVKTGRSKAGLEEQISVLGDQSGIASRIFDLVPYAKYIKPVSLDRKSAFVELLRKPLRKKADALVGELAEFAKTKLVGG